MPYFINGDYNYNELPDDCKSNNLLENYNLIMKKSLGLKYNLSWNKFNLFIKNELDQISLKLTTNTDKNIE